MINFGTGGWRAVIGDDFIRENIQKFAQGIAQYAKEQGKTEKPIALLLDMQMVAERTSVTMLRIRLKKGVNLWLQSLLQSTQPMMAIKRAH